MADLPDAAALHLEIEKLIEVDHKDELAGLWLAVTRPLPEVRRNKTFEYDVPLGKCYRDNDPVILYFVNQLKAKGFSVSLNYTQEIDLITGNGKVMYIRGLTLSF